MNHEVSCSSSSQTSSSSAFPLPVDPNDAAPGNAPTERFQGLLNGPGARFSYMRSPNSGGSAPQTTKTLRSACHAPRRGSQRCSKDYASSLKRRFSHRIRSGRGGLHAQALQGAPIRRFYTTVHVHRAMARRCRSRQRPVRHAFHSIAPVHCVLPVQDAVERGEFHRGHHVAEDEHRKGDGPEKKNQPHVSVD